MAPSPSETSPAPRDHPCRPPARGPRPLAKRWPARRRRNPRAPDPHGRDRPPACRRRSTTRGKTPLDATDALRRKLLDATRIVRAMGLFEGNSGHISLRVPGTRDILIPCHLHDEGRPLTFDRLGPEHILRLHLDDHTYEGTPGLAPPDEYWIHSAIYDARPNAGAVVHTHPDYPVALSMADVTVKPMHHLATVFAPEVPIWDNHLQVSDRATSAAMLAAMGDNCAVVLRGHGLVTLGATVEEAVAVSRIVDVSARRQYMAAQVGTPRPLAIRDRAWELGNESIENIWAYFLHVAPAGSEA